MRSPSQPQEIHAKGDALKQWMEYSRVVLALYFPEATYAVLIAGMPGGAPSVSLPVTPPASSAAPPVARG